MVIPKINSEHGSETRNIINAAIDAINVQGKSIQDLVAEGQLTPTQYAELITIINSNLKSGEVGKFDLTPELRLEVNRISEKIDKGNVTESDITGTLRTLVNSIPNKINRGEVTFDDIDINKGKLLPKHLSEEVLKIVTGDAPINAVPANESLTTAKYAPKSVTRPKLSDSFASGGTLSEDQHLDNVTAEGVYLKQTGTTVLGAPEGIGIFGKLFTLEVRTWNQDNLVQKIYEYYNVDAVDYYERYKRLGTYTPWVRKSSDDSILNIINSDKLPMLMNALEKNTNEHVPADFVEKAYAIQGVEIIGANPDYPVKVWMVYRNEERFGYRIDIGQKRNGVWSLLASSGTGFSVVESSGGATTVSFSQNGVTVKMRINYNLIENGTAYLDQSKMTAEPYFVIRPENVKMEQSGGSGGEAYDQTLNSYDNVSFNSLSTGSVNSDALYVSGNIPSGTLSSPPTGLQTGDMWADTTDSVAHPLVRIKL